jgi:hypothetical protein
MLQVWLVLPKVRVYLLTMIIQSQTFRASSPGEGAIGGVAGNGVRSGIALGVVIWFVVMLLIAATGGFEAGAGSPPIAVAVAALIPPAAVVAMLIGSNRFHHWAASLDLRLLTMLQGWRVVGLAFLVLAGEGALPDTFAIPAGYGDILIGATAPFVAVLVVGGGAIARRLYYGWVVLGVADLALAITVGILHSNSPLGLLRGTGPDTDAMGTLPMSLIPTFGVPIALVLHALALTAARRATWMRPERCATTTAAPRWHRPRP